MLKLEALSVLALIGVSLVRSQDSAEFGATMAPTSQDSPMLQTNISSVPPGIIASNVVQCYLPEASDQSSELVPIKEITSDLAALPTGVKCYSIFSDGILEGTPFTTIGVPFSASVTDITLTSSFASSDPTAGGALSSDESGSSTTQLKVVLPAVLGSIALGLLIVVALIRFRKSKRNNNSSRRTSRHAWVDRPGGWVHDAIEGDRKEDIALKERNSRSV